MHRDSIEEHKFSFFNHNYSSCPDLKYSLHFKLATAVLVFFVFSVSAYIGHQGQAVPVISTYKAKNMQDLLDFDHQKLRDFSTQAINDTFSANSQEDVIDATDKYYSSNGVRNLIGENTTLFSNRFKSNQPKIKTNATADRYSFNLQYINNKEMVYSIKFKENIINNSKVSTQDKVACFSLIAKQDKIRIDNIKIFNAAPTYQCDSFFSK